MESITEIIKPISLLKGSHEDTAKTGSGCFMNVIAYLNGEAQITDQSPCVCVTVRKIAIWLNDFLRDDERGEMIPFIDRAMGSATDDKAEMARRLCLVVKFASRQRDLAKAYTPATYAAATAATYAAAAATYAADDKFRGEIKAVAFEFLDAALPKAVQPTGPLIERAKSLVACASH